MRPIASAFAATLALSMAVSANAAVPTVNGSGQLTGATGVIVNGTQYDVAFADGSCNSLFGGCDPAQFAFNDKPSATAAAQALIDQVFLDGSAGNFDSFPGLTVGCGTVTFLCNTVIPYHVESLVVITAGAANVIGASCCDFAFAPYGGATDLDTSLVDGLNYAIFTVAAVPEPSIWAMMLLGFGAVGYGLRRRRKMLVPQVA